MNFPLSYNLQQVYSISILPMSNLGTHSHANSEKLLRNDVLIIEELKLEHSSNDKPYATEYQESQNLILDDKVKEELKEEESLSEDEADKQREKKINQFLHSQNLKQTSNEKMVVGTGFSMDVTEFFQFKKKELKSDKDTGVLEEISGSRIAWLILLYSVSTGAMIPGWIMNIKANKLLRISWRFLMQSIMVIPFVLYQYRTGGEAVRKKYNLKYIFNVTNFIKPLVSSLATSMWFTMILAGFEWTSVSHSIVLGSLSNFFLSLGRSWRKSSHDLQSGGQILVVGGLILVIYDSITFGPGQISDYDYNVNNTFFLQRKWWQRVIFDLSSFTMSFFMSQFSKYTSDLGSYFPPFLSMFIVNNLNCVNMAFSCYFINGCDWDFDSFWGIWSLFSNLHFAGFMYMAIILSLGQIVSLVMISRMFPDPIIPAVAMTLQPYIATLILDVAGIQKLPGNFTIIGYLFLVPGLSLILVGQCLFQRISARQQANEERYEELWQELKELKSRREERKKKRLERKQQQIKIMISGTPGDSGIRKASD